MRARTRSNPSRRLLQAVSIHLAVIMVTGGPFLALLSTSLLRFGGNERLLKALHLALPDQPRSLAILTPKNRTLIPVAALFSKAAQAVVAEGAARTFQVDCAANAAATQTTARRTEASCTAEVRSG